MTDKVRKLLKSEPYLLERHYSPKSGDYYHVVTIDRKAYSESQTDMSVIKEHFNSGTWHNILSWRFRDHTEPEELISLAILKALV